jgi:hypothetical protein
VGRYLIKKMYLSQSIEQARKRTAKRMRACSTRRLCAGAEPTREVSMSETESLLARCDFCGKAALMVRWNQRTCTSCEADGAPDQSVGEFNDYLERYRAYKASGGSQKPDRVAAGGLGHVGSKQAFLKAKRASGKKVSTKRLPRMPQDARTPGP